MAEPLDDHDAADAVEDGPDVADPDVADPDVSRKWIFTMSPIQLKTIQRDRRSRKWRKDGP